MGATRGETIHLDATDDGEVHRSVQDLWRAQNAAWRARVLGQLRAAPHRCEAVPVTDLRAAPA